MGEVAGACAGMVRGESAYGGCGRVCGWGAGCVQMHEVSWGVMVGVGMYVHACVLVGWPSESPECKALDLQGMAESQASLAQLHSAQLPMISPQSQAEVAAACEASPTRPHNPCQGAAEGESSAQAGFCPCLL